MKLLSTRLPWREGARLVLLGWNQSLGGGTVWPHPDALQQLLLW